jgi:hypothetical protein
LQQPLNAEENPFHRQILISSFLFVSLDSKPLYA